jgi:dihydroflavonol-4-reductase
MNKLAVITGATGLLGSNLAIALLNEGYRVRCTKRKTSKTEFLSAFPQIEWVDADLSEKEALVNAIKDADVVFHCAAQVNLFRYVTPDMAKVNVEGTKNIIDAVIANTRTVEGEKLPRLVHCSSVVTVGIAESYDNPSDETREWNFDKWGLDDAYTITKTDAEKLVQNAIKEQGLNAVIVNPTYMIGAYDQGPSSGGLIISVVKGKLPGVPTGRMCFVDVEDVCKGMIAAWHKGRTGERYILSGHNMLYKDFFDLTAKLEGVQPPTRALPKILGLSAGWVGEMHQYFTGKEEDLNIQKVRWSYCENWVFKADKAKQELDYTISPIEPAITRALTWFKENKMI